METIRFLLTADSGVTRQVITQIESLRDIEHVEEVRTLMGGMRDDSSSAGLNAEQESETHSIVVEAPDLAAAGRVRETVEACAHALDAAVEWVDRF